MISAIQSISYVLIGNMIFEIKGMIFSLLADPFHHLLFCQHAGTEYLFRISIR